MIHVELGLAVLEQLTEFEQRCTFEKKFGDDTSGTEDIHSFGHSTVLLSLNVFPCPSQFGLLGTNLGILTCRVEPFGCNITSSASRGVKVEGEIGRVVEWKVSRLVRSEIRDIHPIPGCNEDVLAFDISMGDLAATSITKSREDLECDPLLLDR